MKKPGVGHLFQRGKTYWLEFTVDGQRFRQSLETRDKVEAKQKAESKLQPYRAGTEADRLAVIASRINAAKRQAATSGTTASMAGAWGLFLALDKERRPYPGPATLAQYEGHLGAFVDWMEKNAPGVKTLAAVKEDHAVRFIRHLNEQGLADGRVNKYKRFLKMFFRVMAKPYGLAENPFAGIQTSKLVVQAAKQPFTVEELRQIVTKAEGEMQTLYLLGAGLGLRLGDCCTLLWGEVDLARRLVLRVPRKTARKGQSVKIGMPPWLPSHLESLPRRGPYVLPGLAAEYEAGKSPNITNRIQKHLEACGILTVKPGTGEGSEEKDSKGHPIPGTAKRAVVMKGFHSFRHSFVSLNADAGTPQATMQKIVGHGSPAMTLHYLTPSDSMVLKAADALPALLAGPKSEKAPTLEVMVPAAEIRNLVETLTPSNAAKVRAQLLKMLES